MCIDQNNCLKIFLSVFIFDFDGIMFKIERASKYRKMNCLSKYLICFFKIEKTQYRSSLLVRNNFTFHQLL